MKKTIILIFLVVVVVISLGFMLSIMYNSKEKICSMDCGWHRNTDTGQCVDLGICCKVPEKYITDETCPEKSIDSMLIPSGTPHIGGDCALVPESGTCLGMFQKYYFDKKESVCKEFTWGGCGGVVPFETLNECQNICKEIHIPITRVTGTVETFNQLSPFIAVENQSLFVVPYRKDLNSKFSSKSIRIHPGESFEFYVEPGEYCIAGMSREYEPELISRVNSRLRNSEQFLISSQECLDEYYKACYSMFTVSEEDIELNLTIDTSNPCITGGPNDIDVQPYCDTSADCILVADIRKDCFEPCSKGSCDFEYYDLCEVTYKYDLGNNALSHCNPLNQNIKNCQIPEISCVGGKCVGTI